MKIHGPDQLLEIIEAKRGALPIALALEQHFSLQDVLELRRFVDIDECNEPLVEVPEDVAVRMFPHPYVAAGAPYGLLSPFALRLGVVERLREAARVLSLRRPGYRLLIFDGYRPTAVQAYMRESESRRIATERGLDASTAEPGARREVEALVDSVWAVPSSDPKMPTPHSTGAAVDLTIIDEAGQVIPMGSEFDEASKRSQPHFFADDPHSSLFHENRVLLCDIMNQAGFERLPHEWWHFSYGDQMWSVLSGLKSGGPLAARYGGR